MTFQEEPMKKLFILLEAAFLTLLLCMFGAYVRQAEASAGSSLIIYYSLSGNTKNVAATLRELVGGDIMEIKTVHPYPDDFDAVVEQARAERNSGFLPPIQDLALSPEDYDVIYLGYPVWANTIPQPLSTFLSQHHLAGTTIVPFCTHDGYGPGRSVQVIRSLCPEARVLPGFDMLGSQARQARELLVAWLKELGIPPQQSAEAGQTPILITIGEHRLEGILNSGSEARQFLEMLPLGISMVQYGGREYYGGMEQRIDTEEQGRLFFDNGDITYCPENNSIAIFYAQTDRPNLTMHVIPMGKVTSDLSLFDALQQRENITFSLKK